MGYYFDRQPEVKSHPEKLLYSIGDDCLSLWVDEGIFSKRGLDIGTQVLLTALREKLPLAFRQSALSHKFCTCLDLGCGMGVIPCFLNRWFSDIDFTAVDINQRACNLAERNFIEQKVKGRIICSNGCAFLSDESFDIIVTNPPVRIGKQAMYTLLKDAYAKLKPAGNMYLVIGKKQGAESLQRFVQEFATCVERVHREAGFWVLHLQK